jgi:hypothetical protein
MSRFGLWVRGLTRITWISLPSCCFTTRFDPIEGSQASTVFVVWGGDVHAALAADFNARPMRRIGFSRRLTE